jgi:hypothetical protein
MHPETRMMSSVCSQFRYFSCANANDLGCRFLFFLLFFIYLKNQYFYPATCTYDKDAVPGVQDWIRRRRVPKVNGRRDGRWERGRRSRQE